MLERFFVPLVHETGQKLVVPMQVLDEVQRHLVSSEPELRRKAQRADDLLRRYRAMGLADVFGEARGLRRRATEVRRALNTTDPPEGGDPEWWDEQARVVARALDEAAEKIERVAHLPPQIDPLPFPQRTSVEEDAVCG